MNDTQITAAAPAPPRARTRRLTPPLWWWALVALAAVAIVVLKNVPLVDEPGMTNMICISLGMLMVLILLAWMFFRSGFTWRARLVGLGGLVIVVALLGASYSFAGWTGNMIPQFKLRPWVRQALAQLNLMSEQDPLPEATGEAVDLATTTPNDFPQFLGPNRDNAVTNVKLSRDWDKKPPRLVWKQDIGPAWSGFAVVNGFAVTMEQRNNDEVVTCYNLKTGKLCWSHGYPARHYEVMGGLGPRSTPTIHKGKVYTLGSTGILLCLDGATGKELWRKDLPHEFGVPEDKRAEHPYFGWSNSPLVVHDLVIVPAGGLEGQSVSLVAYNKDSGDKVWSEGNRRVSYSSPAFAKLAGVEQILIVNEDWASGHDAKTGKVLWEFEWPGNSNKDANSSQAVPVAPDKVFISKGYMLGAALFQLQPKGDGTFEPKQLWRKSNLLRTKFTNVAIKDGLVFGLSDGLLLECVELETGKKKWAERGNGFGHGQLLRVGDLLLVLSESGEVTLWEASAKHDGKPLGRFQAVDGVTWNNLALYGPYLLVRNADEAACYELPVE